ncbi:MAG: glycosyltransferase [Luteimonas sp.]
MIRIIGRDNGVGLSRDLQLIAEVLCGGGHRVETLGYADSQVANRVREAGQWAQRLLHGRSDVQLFVERVYQRCLPLAHSNLLMPNPEWFLPKWQRYLPRFDAVLCKTRHAEAIFSALGCTTVLTGFTSEDRHEVSIPKERAFFHLAGRSVAKGTDTLLATWRRHPRWPRLTVVQHPALARRGVAAPNIVHCVEYFSALALVWLQNSHRFHICPSEAEGFGHYLMEAMAVGAVVLTTDAPPMNEMVTAERGVLIAPARVERRGLVDFNLVDTATIEDAVERALAMDDAQCAQLGQAARAFFLDNDLRFRARLLSAFDVPPPTPG